MIVPRAYRQDSQGPLRLHIGCGQEAIDGWIHANIGELAVEERMLGMREGLSFEQVAAISAAHFVEHWRETLPEEIRNGFQELPLSPWDRLKLAALRRVRRLR